MKLVGACVCVRAWCVRNNCRDSTRSFAYECFPSFIQRLERHPTTEGARRWGNVISTGFMRARIRIIAPAITVKLGGASGTETNENESEDKRVEQRGPKGEREREREREGTCGAPKYFRRGGSITPRILEYNPHSFEVHSVKNLLISFTVASMCINVFLLFTFIFLFCFLR